MEHTYIVKDVYLTTTGIQTEREQFIAQKENYFPHPSIIKLEPSITPYRSLCLWHYYCRLKNSHHLRSAEVNQDLQHQLGHINQRYYQICTFFLPVSGVKNRAKEEIATNGRRRGIGRRVDVEVRMLTFVDLLPLRTHRKARK